jgi:hypothetical protein
MAQWLLPTDKQWISTLEEAEHDFYHLPCYVELASYIDKGKPKAYYDELATGKVLIPLLVRSMPADISGRSGFLDATSPYGFPGPVFTRDIDTQDTITGINRFIEFGNKTGLVTTFIRLHPLLNRQIWSMFSGNQQVKLIPRGATVSIDLSPEIDQLDSRLRRNHRQNIAKLRASGFTVRMDDWDKDYSSFRDIYYQTMRRRGASTYYFFSEEYFRRLRRCLGSSLHICSVVSPDGQVASAGLFVKTGRIVQGHLTASSERFLSLAPSKLMFYEVRNWAKAAGAKLFHLGGGVGGERDSLFLFKRGLGTHEHSFETVGIVHDLDAYHKLYEQWFYSSNENDILASGYFPFYRTVPGYK